jgi:hypothetical protein
VIECRSDFLDKVAATLDVIRRLVPACCGPLVAAALLVACSGRPGGDDAGASSRGVTDPPSIDDPDCVRDQDCELLPYVTCCGECAPAPPFEAVTRQQLDAVFIELESRCAIDRRECTPPVCERVPRGCYARAGCVAGRCVVESEGC